MSEAHSADGSVLGRARRPIRIGVLSFHNSKETKALLNAIQALGHDPVWLRESNTRSWMSNGVIKIEPDVDVVINRLLTSQAGQPLADLGVASSLAAARPVLNRPAAVINAMHKFSAAATLVTAGISVPDAYMPLAADDPATRPHRFLGKVVLRPAIGTHGNGMELLDDADPVSPTVAQRRAFLQQFLESDAARPFDVRIYVVDGTIIGAMKRIAPADDWRTNVARGGRIEDFTPHLPRQVGALAVRATDVLDLDYAGVDLLCNRDTWYVLEVNPTAGFTGLFAATGVNPAPHIVALAIGRVDGTVDGEYTEALATTLDDSVPDCKPPSVPEPDRPTEIGFTERVLLCGAAAQHQSVAKVDTGAKRTSVDLPIAASIGAGPIVGTTRVRSGMQTDSQIRPLVELDVKLVDRWHTIVASLEDRSHMNYPVLLGRDILSGYQIDINQRVDEE